MSGAAPNSAEVLRKIWASYTEGYKKTLGREPSMRETSDQIGLDPSALAKWMSVDAPASRRVPVSMIPILEDALMMSAGELDELMVARLTELSETEDVMAACNWLAGFLERSTALSQEEGLVLATFRSSREKYPLGLHLDAEEHTMMRAQMEVLLERAQVHELDLRFQDAENTSPDMRAKQARQVARLKAAFPKPRKGSPSEYKQGKDRAATKLRKAQKRLDGGAKTTVCQFLD